MTFRRPPRLAVALLERFVPDNEPLTGDLLRAGASDPTPGCGGRCSSPQWRERYLNVRSHPRVTTGEALVATAMLGLLGFNAVVVASLMNRLSS